MKMLRSLLALALLLVTMPALAQVTPGTSPLSIAKGGTKCSAASGTCLDNITGFSGTGLINRTGAGTYAFAPLTGFVTCGANQFVNVVGAASFCAQPAFSNLSGQATLAQLPTVGANTVLGSVAGGTPVALSQAQLTALINAFTTSLPGSAPASGGGTTNFLRADGSWAAPPNASGGVVDNFLPNSQWQLWSGVTFGIKNNAAGTASQATVACSAFNLSNAAPTFTCANTQTLRTGDLAILSTVAFWNFAGAGAITCVQVNCTPGEQALGNYVTGVRIGTVVPNTSVNIPNPGFSGVSPAASTAINIVPIAPGDLAGTGTNGPTGWTKSASLIATIDDWGAAATPASTVYPGCERPLLLRKGITGQEIFEASVPPNMIKKFTGQTVTFGAAVYQRVQGGASTWNLHIDDTGGSNASSNGTGSGLGGYQFLSVTRTISQTATSIVFYINLLGNSGDVFDVCLPTAAFVSTMAQYQLHQNSSECISSRHWNPPLLDPFIITFPSSALVAGLWGWNGIDLEAISFGTVHNTVQYVIGDLEWTSNNVATPANPSTVFFGSNTANLNFGIKAGTIVNGTTFSTSATSVPLWTDGTVAFLTGVTALVPTNGTFDFWDVCVSPGSWNN